MPSGSPDTPDRHPLHIHPSRASSGHVVLKCIHLQSTFNLIISAWLVGLHQSSKRSSSSFYLVPLRRFAWSVSFMSTVLMCTGSNYIRADQLPVFIQVRYYTQFYLGLQWNGFKIQKIYFTFKNFNIKGPIFSDLFFSSWTLVEQSYFWIIIQKYLQISQKP